MSLKLRILTTFSFGLNLILIGGIAIYIYLGSYRNEEYSPDGQYILRYYHSFNPFLMFTPVFPGDSSCKAIWIRLYNTKDEKLNEVFTDDCHLEFVPEWYGNKVFLPNMDMWLLPNPVSKNTDLNAP